ncbi:MAG: glycosyltransferase [Faecalibacterium sp.]|nr:glycosyltransferase [Faecalibacterium sp.]
MLNDTVSIIVPIYNKEKYLEKCLDSILGQTYRDLEIILVDDGSQDGSLEICRKYAEKNERIHVYAKKNGGVASARNLGLEKSQGSFLAFVDPDDYLHPECISLLKKAVDETGAEIAYCHAMDVDSKTGETKTISGETGAYRVIPADSYDWFDRMAHSVSWGTIYRRSVAEQVRFDDDLKIGEDTLFLAKCIHAAHSIVRVDRALYYYYINDDSVTSGRYTERKLDELEAWRRVCQVFEDKPVVLETAQAGYAIRCRMIAIKYCKDAKFMERACTEVGTEFHAVGKILLKKWRATGKWNYYLKTLFSYYCWNAWIKLKQTRKTYEVEL